MKRRRQTSYLEEIDGRIATTKDVDEWRYLLALYIGIYFEMNNSDACNSKLNIESMAKYQLKIQQKLNVLTLKPDLGTISQLGTDLCWKPPRLRHRTSDYELLHHVISLTRLEHEKEIQQLHCHLEVPSLKLRNLV